MVEFIDKRKEIAMHVGVEFFLKTRKHFNVEEHLTFKHRLGSKTTRKAREFHLKSSNVK